jgi:KUP system potassium uptake protein
VTRNRNREEGPLSEFVEKVRAMKPPMHRAPGTAVFLHANPETTPLALRANLEHNHVVHRSVIILSLKTGTVPRVRAAERLVIDDLGYRDDGIIRVEASYGFLDRQNVPRTLASAARRGLERSVDVQGASYFLSRTTIVRSRARDDAPLAQASVHRPVAQLGGPGRLFRPSRGADGHHGLLDRDLGEPRR